MEPWLKTSLILCVFGFLKEFRPSESFVTNFLLGPWKNFTVEQVNKEIFVVGTYAYLSVVFVVFLVTDLLRYKPVIVVNGVTGIVTWSILAWGHTVPLMQAVEFGYGFFIACEVAYYTYIYAQVDRSHFQQVTSHTRTAYLLGRFTSAAISQLLVSTSLMDYYQLNFLTLGAMILATLWAIFLPSAPHSVYFHRVEESPSPTGSRLLRAYGLLWRDCKAAYSNFYVVKWSIWWAVATSGFAMGITYVQVLWDTIVRENNDDSLDALHLYNAAFDAAYTLVGAAAALATGWLRLNWALVGEMTLAIFSLLQGAVLVGSALTNSIWLAYALYVAFGILYHTMITIANSEVAKHISEDSYGLIFGINTFFTLVINSVLTAVVVGHGGLELGARSQYLVYGGYYVVLGCFFLITSFYTMCTKNICKEKLWLPPPPQKEPEIERQP